MKHILLSSTFLFACLLGACSSEKDVSCDVVWSDAADAEVGTGTIVYEALDDVDAGLDMCKEDQMDHADRPMEAAAYTCNCST